MARSRGLAVTPETARRIVEVINTAPGPLHTRPSRGIGSGRHPMLVLCESSEPAGESGVAGQVYPAVIIAGYTTETTQTQFGRAWLTVLGTDAEAVEPVAGQTYLAMRAGDFDPDMDGEESDPGPRVFATVGSGSGGGGGSAACDCNWLAALEPDGCLRFTVGNSEDPLLTGLEGFWRFDGNLDDSSGNGNHLEPVGTTVYGTGLIGQALNANEPRLLPMPVEVTGEFTFNFWNRFGLNGLSTIWLVRRSGAVSFIEVRCNFGDYTFGVNGSFQTGPARTLNEWQMLTVQFKIEAGNTLTEFRIARNGGSWFSYTGLPIAAASDWKESLAIRGIEPSSDWRHDLAGLWNRYLTATEISRLYNGGAGFDPTA